MTPEAHWGQNTSSDCSLSQKMSHFPNWKHSSWKSSYPLIYKIQNNPQITPLWLQEPYGAMPWTPTPVLTGEFPVPSRRSPTLHVKDRVQGFLVSRSMTPQWMSGSNSLSVKSIQTLPRAHQTFLPLFWKQKEKSRNRHIFNLNTIYDITNRKNLQHVSPTKQQETPQRAGVYHHHLTEKRTCKSALLHLSICKDTPRKLVLQYLQTHALLKARVKRSDVLLKELSPKAEADQP